MKKAPDILSSSIKLFKISGANHMVGVDGFEPSKRNVADLQSAPFDRSGTLPYLGALASECLCIISNPHTKCKGFFEFLLTNKNSCFSKF